MRKPLSSRVGCGTAARTRFALLCVLAGLAGGAYAQATAPAEAERIASDLRREWESAHLFLTASQGRAKESLQERLRALGRGAASKDLTLQLWMHHLEEECANAGGSWIQSVMGVKHLPEELAGALRESLLAIDQRRAEHLDRLSREEERASQRLTELERRLTQRNRIDDAVAARRMAESLRADPAGKTARSGLEELLREPDDEAATMAFSELDSGDLRLKAPPGARMLFGRDNPAFRRFAEIVRVRSVPGAGGKAEIAMGPSFQFTGMRGLSVLALHRREVVLQRTYDTYAKESESSEFARDIRELPYGAFVVVAVGDEATRRFQGSAQSALFRLGATSGLRPLPYRSAYFLVGVKGMKPGEGIEAFGPNALTHPPSPPVNEE